MAITEMLSSVDPKDPATQGGFGKLCNALVDSQKKLGLQPALTLLSSLWTLPGVSDTQKRSFSEALKSRISAEIHLISHPPPQTQEEGAFVDDSELYIFQDNHKSVLQNGLPLLSVHVASLLSEITHNLPSDDGEGLAEKDEDLLALISCLLSSQLSQQDVGSVQLPELHNLVLRQAQSLQIAVMGSLMSQTDRTPSEPQTLDLPNLTVIRAILHIVSKVALLRHEKENHVSSSSKSPPPTHLSETLSRLSRDGRGVNGVARQDSVLQARAKTKDLSRQAAEASSRRLKHPDLSADASSLGGSIDVLLALLEACIAFCWAVTPDGTEGEFMMRMALLALKELQPLLNIWLSSSSDNTLPRLQALVQSTALLSQPTQPDSAESPAGNANLASSHQKRDMRWALPAYKAASLTQTQQVCWTLLEVIGQSVAPVWQSYNTLPLDSAFIPLTDMSHPDADADETEQQVLILLLCHMVVAAGAGEGLTRVAYPLLSEAASQPHTSEASACALFSLAECGRASAGNDHRLGFEQAISLLISSFQGAFKLQSADAEKACAIVTDSLTILADMPSSTPLLYRQELEMKLLSLFADSALHARSETHLRCLGTLLIPLSRTWGVNNSVITPTTQRSLMSTNSMDFETLKALRFDTQLVKLYRILWVCIAVHGIAQTQSTQSKQGRPRWPPEWREAAILLAQGPTPLLVAGGELDVFQVEAELGERVQRLSKTVSPFKVAARLLEGIRSGQTVAPGLVATATHPARNAHLLSTLALNLLRVTVPSNVEVPAQCPLAPLFTTQMVASTKDWESDWLAAITERCFNVYLTNLRPIPSLQGSDAGMLAKRQIMLAGTLLQTLSDTSHNADARDLANKLLERLLKTFPSLTWNAGLLKSFLTTLDAPADCDYLITPDPRVATQLRRVIERGMIIAPNATEALLCEYLRMEPNKSNERSLAEAQNLLLRNHDQLQNQGGRIQGPPSGITAWRKKDRYTGLSSPIRGSPQHNMQNALTDFRKALTETSTAGLLHSSLITTGVLVETPRHPQSKEALGLIARLPGIHLQSTIVRNAVFAWHWIVAAVPELLLPLLEEIVHGWSTTIQRRRGLFDIRLDEAHTAPDLDVGEMLDDDSSDEGSKRMDSLVAHHVWLDFFHEIWQISTGSASPESASIARLYSKLLNDSLDQSGMLTQQPAAAGVTFKLLSLGLHFLRYLAMSENETTSGSSATLFNKLTNAALHWFDAKPAYCGDWSATEKWVEYVSVQSFLQELEGALKSMGTVLMVQEKGPSKDKVSLLKMLLQNESDRLKVWANPLVHASKRGSKLKASVWKTHATAAWECRPSLAINLIARFPHADELRRVVGALVTQNAASQTLQNSPQAAEVLAQSTADESALENLKSWAPGTLLRSLHLMSSPCGKNPKVRQYALRSLHTCDPDQVAFFLPQLVQLLRSDEGGMTEEFLLESAKRTIVFAHHLVCTLRSEGTPPEEAFNPAVKRSGWAAPENTGLWKIADSIEKKVWSVLNADSLAYLKAEIEFFDEVTNVSGKLYPVPKDERKSAAVRIVREIPLPRSDLYLPTNPASRVVSIITESATPMQSAAKTPILVAFKVVDEKEGTEEKPQACIFKVGDDCRQDVLALQVIGLLKNAFQKSGLELYVAPYGVLPTTYECGIIEVVPNTESRSALGEISDGGLLDIWQRKFGASGSPSFQKAVRNFLKSEAGYAIACYLLQAKDRHNGNILLDSLGHLVHIDFGFILEISPGGNLGFESAAFKLSHEMTQLMDPSGARTSPQFRTFQELCIRGYLAARTVAEEIIATVQLMSESGLPCYGRGAPIANLRKRFHLEMSDAQAAAFMQQTINDAYDKWTTGFYDYVQYLQNSIPK